MSHGILVCDKASARSSHAVVALLRKALKTRDVGHAGTLDPMGTGVLVMAVGEGLKILRYLVLDDKVYEATIRLGSETDTDDSEGKVLRSAPVPEGLTIDRVREVCQSFEGHIVQQAPAVSAIKQGGVALFERVRRGEQVAAPERQVEVKSLAVLALRDNELDLRVHSGKGFYVRALARDLGLALGTHGHLSALRRTRSGVFGIEESVPMELLVAAAQGDEAARSTLCARVLPVEAALRGVLSVKLDEAGVAHVRQGRPVPFEHIVEGAIPGLDADQEPVLLCDREGTPVALAHCTLGAMKIKRGLHL